MEGQNEKVKKDENEKKSLLIICAHPDDEVFGAGATVAKYVMDGWKARAIIFSYGEKSHIWLQKRVTIEMRVNEAKNADRIIGCSEPPIFLGLEEGKFLTQLKEKGLDKKIEEVIIQERPSKIFTHSYDDPHPDHRAVERAVREAVKNSGLNCEVLMFEVWNLINFRKRDKPRIYVNVSNTFDIKMAALREFKSQWIAMIPLLPKVFISTLVNGVYAGCLYAEKFYKG
ncbi:MAG: PIG-L deacetylase family protein [Candidatus Woesearchaeota archaeon]